MNQRPTLIRTVAEYVDPVPRAIMSIDQIITFIRNMEDIALPVDKPVIYGLPYVRKP
jgi:hypothetical protein